MASYRIVSHPKNNPCALHIKACGGITPGKEKGAKASLGRKAFTCDAVQIGLCLANGKLQSKDCPLEGPHVSQKRSGLLHDCLAQPLAGDCQRRLISAQKQKQTLKALTAGDAQLTTFLGAGLLSPFLERDLSAATLCLPEISLKIPDRLAHHWSGILSKGFLHQVGFGDG